MPDFTIVEMVRYLVPNVANADDALEEFLQAEDRDERFFVAVEDRHVFKATP